jgi:hypothetical protein
LPQRGPDPERHEAAEGQAVRDPQLQKETLTGRWKVVKARVRGGFGTVVVRAGC